MAKMGLRWLSSFGVYVRILNEAVKYKFIAQFGLLQRERVEKPSLTAQSPNQPHRSM